MKDLLAAQAAELGLGHGRIDARQQHAEFDAAAAVAEARGIEGRAGRSRVFEVLRLANRAPAVGQRYMRRARRSEHLHRVSHLSTHRPQAETGLPARAERRGGLSRTGVFAVAWDGDRILARRKATAPAGRLQKTRIPVRQPQRPRTARP